jgi:hypothetical protein
MGDRCYVEITVRECDRDEWESLGYDEEGDDTEGALNLADTERNYGVSDSLDLAEGCPMFGYHSEGGEYPAMLFAYDGEIFLKHECNQNRCVVIECHPEGPSSEDIEAAQEFLAFSSRVESMVLGSKEIANAE